MSKQSCGAKCEVYSRVVGYYRPVQQWNPGKQTEFAQRSVFDQRGPASGSRRQYPKPHDPTPGDLDLSTVPLKMLRKPEVSDV
ncbi:MAG: anaerobic ribonucleoside-triphosphate reductase [Candidatus Alcyoniella australis]|nr:anaerobic ribonucleoside-triphosphate reductase [Candidatus Alcyoniella australis]